MFTIKRVIRELLLKALGVEDLKGLNKIESATGKEYFFLEMPKGDIEIINKDQETAYICFKNYVACTEMKVRVDNLIQEIEYNIEINIMPGEM